MALQQQYNNDIHGLIVDGAYFKVEHFSGNDSGITVRVAIWPSVDARQSLKIPLEVKDLEVPSEAFNGTVASIYTHLKTLPEFSGAIDV